MKNRELVAMQLKLRAAYAYALQTPELLADREAVESIHNKLSHVVQPKRTEPRELTTLVSEGE